jgi:hypothetical protein
MLMGAINFDQPSKGTVVSTSKALTIINTDSGGALSCIAENATGHCIMADSKGNGIGVYAVSQSNHGVRGECKGEKGVGVYGISAGGTGVYAVSNSSNGVRGESQGAGVGVYGVSASGTGVYAVSKSQNGVKGESQAAGVGVWGISVDGTGVYAVSKSQNGVKAESQGNGIGVWGKSATGNGVRAESLGADGTGIYATGGKLAGYFKGDVEVTGDIRLVNADCAEEFDVSEEIESGTVMVLDMNGNLEPSCVAYDRKVAGIISGAGGFKPGIVLDKREQKSGTARMAVALMGKVFCKVDATFSSVEIGDLLTTSPTIGHAMKANDPLKAFGAVIGKALQPLKDGKGMISVLVALQ